MKRIEAQLRALRRIRRRRRRRTLIAGGAALSATVAAALSLAYFTEDADITTATAPGAHLAGENLSIWHEGRIPWRDGDRDYNGVFLGWNRAKGAPAATYAITLPEGAAAKWQLAPASTVEISMAALDEDAPLPGKKKDDKEPDKSKEKERESPDFTVELATADGTPAELGTSYGGCMAMVA